MDDLFRTRLVIQAALYSRTEILQRMGYKRPSPANLARLESVLKSDACGLDQSGFDFRFSAEAFLGALSHAVGVGDHLARAFIEEYRQAQDAQRAAFKPWVWVDTQFVRTTQPVFALAACEHQRRLDLPEGAWQLSTRAQIQIATALVRAHYSTLGGHLGIWGEIEQYWLCSSNEQWHRLTCSGALIEGKEAQRPSLSLATFGSARLVNAI